MFGVRLLWDAPLVADRDCDHCERYAYDEKTGTVRKDHNRLPMVRPRNMKPPCSTCAKVPRSVRDDTPPWEINKSHAITPTAQTRQAYDFYRECRAVGHFPDDPIVRWCAKLLRQMEDDRERSERRKSEAYLEQIATLISLLRAR